MQLLRSSTSAINSPVSPRSGSQFFENAYVEFAQSCTAAQNKRTVSRRDKYCRRRQKQGQKYGAERDSDDQEHILPILRHRLRLFDGRAPVEVAEIDHNNNGRVSISETIVERISEGATIPSVPFKERDSCKSVTSKTRTRNWKDRFEFRCKQDSLAREEERLRLDELRRSYRPRIENFKHLYDHTDLSHLQVPEPWLEVWKRNLYCEICWKITTPGVGRYECLTCPVVQHLACTRSKHDNRNIESTMRHNWRCAECTEYMDDAIRFHWHEVRQKRLHRKAARYIILLQCWVRMMAARRRHRKIRLAAQLIQSHFRGKKTRRLFRQQYGPTLFRPFRITVNEVTGMTIPPSWAGNIVEVYVICTIIRSEECIYHDVLANQVARVDMSHRLLDFGNCRVIWDDTQLCLGSTSRTILVMTVLALPKKPQDLFDPLATQNFEFLGQAEFPLEDTILYSKRNRVATLQLGPYVHDICDQQTMRSIKFHRYDHIISGEIRININPCSHAFSNAGYLSELPAKDAVISDSKKRWWIVLANSHLMLLNKPTDAKPKFTFPLKDLLNIRLNKSVNCFSLELKGPNFYYIFSHLNSSEVSRWYHKCLYARNHNEHRSQWKHLNTLIKLGISGAKTSTTKSDEIVAGSIGLSEPQPQRRLRRAALSSTDIGLLG